MSVHPPRVLPVHHKLIFSVRTHIREGNTNFAITAQSWPTFCYASCICDVDNIEKGLFRSSLLIKVNVFPSRYD